MGDAVVGRLRLEVDPGRDPFGPGDRRLLEDVGSQVGALVQAVSINRDLQLSRQHLITAREEERRRVRRDLHDGLGPSLATLAMRLDSARDLIPENPALAADLVGQLSDQARDEIAEVRRLVDGLRPPALDQFGLVSALRQRADDHNLATRTGRVAQPTWAVEADEDLEPLPAAVEVAAYRIVVEAVTNAVRHSAADTCAVSLRRDAHALLIEVRDDGVGLASSPVMGVGMASMRERAEELGRHLHADVDARKRDSGTGADPAGRVHPRECGVSMEALRILVVDDHDEFRKGLEAMLAAADAVEVVGSAADGRTAVDLALDLQPDVILMDLQMPRLNGVEATARIVRSSPHIGVLVLTMMEDDDSVFAAVRAGARGYLLKGARRSEILRSIEAVGAGEVIFGPGIAERMMTYFRGVRAKPTVEAFPELTERERIVLGRIAEGLENAEIARELGLSVKTVRNHASNIFAKLQVAHRAQAIILAREAGLE